MFYFVSQWCVKCANKNLRLHREHPTPWRHPQSSRYVQRMCPVMLRLHGWQTGKRTVHRNYEPAGVRTPGCNSAFFLGTWYTAILRLSGGEIHLPIAGRIKWCNQFIECERTSTTTAFEPQFYIWYNEGVLGIWRGYHQEKDGIWTQTTIIANAR